MDCIKNLIVTKNSKLLPTILTALLNLHKKGQFKITAKEVQDECDIMNPKQSWKNRTAAICNGMRTLKDCGWKITSEERDFAGFTIELSKADEGKKISTQSKSTVSDKKETQKLLKKNNMTQQTASNNQLNWDNIYNKLLIIGCAGTKIPGGREIQKNYFSDHESIIEDRNKVLNKYKALLKSTADQDYFNKSRIGRGAVNNEYFINQIDTKLLLPAVERYSGGIFYSAELKELYKQKNNDCNLHILIVSGLYGIVEMNDAIIDYQLEMKKTNIWKARKNNTVHNAVLKYIDDNKIEKDLIFYSLSPTSYENALKPKPEWHNLWVGGDRGSKSAKYLKEFLS